VIKILLTVYVLFLAGCVGIPENVSPVDNFNLDKYLGRWYEIARLDHSFERGLTLVTADYSMQADGGVRVLNRGYSIENKTWKEAEGKAYFVKPESVTLLYSHGILSVVGERLSKEASENVFGRTFGEF